jgi:hypothetical protein
MNEQQEGTMFRRPYKAQGPDSQRELGLYCIS